MSEAIRMVDITKTFGSVIANDAVNLTVNTGEIHALLGENGAGKSTLMNMLSGIYRPDSGSIYIDGKPAHISNPKVSTALGIGMIHQHFKLVDIMTARDNIIVGCKGFVSKKGDVDKQINELCDKYGLVIDLDKKVYNMSVGEKQTLEIIKVLFRGAHILIMDEPTAVLTPQEIESLFSILRNMKEHGRAVVIITHKLNEVMEISDKVTILRSGQSIDTVNTDETSVPYLIRTMVGKSIDLKIDRQTFEDREPPLEIEDLTVLNADGGKALDSLGLTLGSHEILGIAGIAGSGQKELCETIAGLTKAQSGSIKFEGGEILGKSSGEIIKLGIRLGFIPEDRLGMGLVAGMNLIDNVMLKDYRFQKGVMLSRKPGAEKAKRIVEKLDVLTPNLTTPVGRLSGGNIQKVLLGREIDSDPKVLVTSYPVRGLDIGATYKIYDLLNEQKAKGVGIIFVGEDLDVLIELCDRILVLSAGKAVGVLDARDATKSEIGYMMTGTDPHQIAGQQVINLYTEEAEQANG